MRHSEYDGVSLSCFQCAFGRYSNHPEVKRCLKKLRADWAEQHPQANEDAVPDEPLATPAFISDLFGSPCSIFFHAALFEDNK